MQAISRRFALPVVALLASLWLGAPAAFAADVPLLRALQPPFFTADVAVTMDSTAHTSVQVTFTVPYSELSWNRVAGGYACGAGFSVVLEPPRRERLYGDSWERRLLVASYESTRSHRNNLVVTRSFDLPPGRYDVRLRVRDVSSDLESEAQDRLELADLGKMPVGFADLQLGVLDSTGTFTPIPTRRFGYNIDGLAARVVTFDRRAGEWPRQVRLHYRVLDESGAAQLRGDTLVTLHGSAAPLVIRPPGSELFLGTYVFEVERMEGKGRWRTSRSFEVEESGPPRGKDFTQLLEALGYIATSEEIDAMRNLALEQQADAWERFWARRDPTPETSRNEFEIEFFRRLHYADRHFTGFGPGWRSDMGRIYLRHGPPDQIEQHAPSTSSPQLEIWSYQQPYRRYIFADREGFGRYVLLQPAGE